MEHGDVPAKKLTRGFCTEVSTGAPVPDDANGVVMVEFTDTKDGEILIYESTAIGQNIAKEGSDIKEGELLTEKLYTNYPRQNRCFKCNWIEEDSCISETPCCNHIHWK